ncbi:MAG: energy transducer TonB [Terracidiphilus sp.]|jgi:TonB family protein
MRIARVLVLLTGLGASVAGGQQTGSPAPAPPADATSSSAKVYDVGPEVTAPALLPTVWEVMAPDACKEEKDDTVALSLVVDAAGVPRDINPVHPDGSTVEKMALRIVDADRFNPGALKGEPVAVRWAVRVGIQGCLDSKKDDAGSTSTVFRLTAQPVQTFGTLFSPAEALAEAGLKADTGATASQNASGLDRVGGKVSAPVPLNHVEARYTDEARRKKIQGVCLISVIVDTNGKPQNPRVIKSLDPGLDLKAIEAVNKYRFKPAMKDGVPVPVMITVLVNFRLIYQ